jgi:F-type H+-transporting ATPase subunit epsilon
VAETLKLNIITPERRLVDNLDAKIVTLTGSEGVIQILPGHVPMIGTLDTGVFAYEAKNGSSGTGVISSGFFEINEDVINVMAETLELPEEIDVARARAAQQKAEAALKEANLDEHAFKKFQLKLQRALIRQQVGGKK